jgi:hypothetical protein
MRVCAIVEPNDRALEEGNAKWLTANPTPKTTSADTAIAAAPPTV